MKRKVNEWIKKDGVDFFNSIGLREGDKILDFGCGSGYFAVTASKIVGDKGIIYAADKGRKSLKKVDKLAREMDAKNIRTIDTRGSIEVYLRDNSLDFVLLYDVLHQIDNRKDLYSECKRVLKSDGVLSIHPTHYNPGFVRKILNRGIDKDLDGIIEEVMESGFDIEGKIKGNIIHYKSIEKSTILNFKVK
ncbi:MAG: class I SAM-dependent methyltransferase [Candidatus Aenigmatarchaeota archaeon]